MSNNLTNKKVWSVEERQEMANTSHWNIQSFPSRKLPISVRQWKTCYST